MPMDLVCGVEFGEPHVLGIEVVAQPLRDVELEHGLGDEPHPAKLVEDGGGMLLVGQPLAQRLEVGLAQHIEVGSAGVEEAVCRVAE